MAPEVIRHEKYSFKADVYSWAIVINELFSGERPYANRMPIDAARCVVLEHLRPSVKKLDRRSPRLKNLITQAWDAEPKKRPDWDTIIRELTAAQAEYTAAICSGVAGLFCRSIKSNSGETAR